MSRNKLLAALTIIFCSSLAWAQGGAIGRQVIQPPPPVGNGDIAPFAPVRVCTFGSVGTPCPNTITLYADPTLNPLNTLPNPTTADVNGFWGGFVAQGNYLVQETPVNGVTYSYNVFSNGQASVSSVALALPNIFLISGSPVTTTGTLTGTFATQSPNLVFASPNGVTAQPLFRSIVPADFSTVSAYQVLANCTGSTAVPSFCALVANNIPTTLNGTTFTGAISAPSATFSGNVSVQSLTDSGNATVSGTLLSTGQITGNGGLSISGGTTTLNSGLAVTGNSTFNSGTETFNGAATFGSTSAFNGVSTFNFPVVVNATSLTLQGASSLIGQASSTITSQGTFTLNSLFIAPSGASPTCSSTGIGSTGTCVVQAGSSNAGGFITLAPSGSGIFSSGTVTLNLVGSVFGSHYTPCVWILADAGPVGTTTWDPRATIFIEQINGPSLSTPQALFNNNSAVFTSGLDYSMAYWCWGQ